MKNIAIIGNYHAGQEVSDGQGVKTKILTQELKKICGSENVHTIDTYKWKRNPFRLFFKSCMSVYRYDNVMFMTDEGGTKVIPRLLLLCNIFGKCRLHYYVVGGWLKNYLDRSESATKCLKKIDAIYVELPAMEKELINRGFENAVLLNKFRRMTVADAGSLEMNPAQPYKLCYFSRVMKEKGIEQSVEVVKLLNQRAGYTKYNLDIFGSVLEEYKEEFESLKKDFPDYVRYGGVIDFQTSKDVLKNYFAMVFPTSYASEGYPNVIVDAFSAGLPVIATRWNYNADIIHEHEDGLLFDVGDMDQFADTIEELATYNRLYRQMRINCIERCKEYAPENAVKKVYERMK